MILTVLSPAVSAIALAASLFTLWFTILRRGTVKSTHPAFIAVRYDFVNKSLPLAKVVFRVLLFSTGKRGRVVESLFLIVSNGQHQTEFSYWGLSDTDIVRGGGLFVSDTGVVTYHRFNPLETDEVFQFLPGSYSLELKAKLLGQRATTSLWKIPLEIPPGAFADGILQNAAVHFNWSPGEGRYIASIENG